MKAFMKDLGAVQIVGMVWYKPEDYHTKSGSSSPITDFKTSNEKGIES